MLILSSAASTQPDYVALAMVLVLAAMVTVMALRKRFGRKNAAAPVIIPEPAPQPEAPTAPGSAGQVKIYDVPPKTAAMVMAIVADKLGKPLNELRFISIKEVK